jgi:hypothetical protein
VTPEERNGGKAMTLSPAVLRRWWWWRGVRLTAEPPNPLSEMTLS